MSLRRVDSRRSQELFCKRCGRLTVHTTVRSGPWQQLRVVQPEAQGATSRDIISVGDIDVFVRTKICTTDVGHGTMCGAETDTYELVAADLTNITDKLNRLYACVVQLYKCLQV